MQILPVLDLKDGVVVRGRAGQRQNYAPLVGGLGASCQALDMARAFESQLGQRELYLADLDAIAGEEPAWDLYDQLHAAGFTLWLDAGVDIPGQALELAAAGIRHVVVGLESVAGPTALKTILTALPDRVVFSLDLRDGAPILGADTWKGTDARSIANEVIALGVSRLLVLDLARVGVGEGTGTTDLLAKLHDAHPEIELLAGGGVRGLADLMRLHQAGVTRVLVSSALHDGTFDRVTLDRIQAGGIPNSSE